jgi:hypothetical protein
MPQAFYFFLSCCKEKGDRASRKEGYQSQQEPAMISVKRKKVEKKERKDAKA